MLVIRSSYEVVGCWLLGLLTRLLVAGYWVFLRGCWLFVISPGTKLVCARVPRASPAKLLNLLDQMRNADRGPEHA